MSLSQTTRSTPAPDGAAERRIVFRTTGRQHGPIVRLVSPGDVGERIKPFVFLDYIDVDAQSAPAFGWHPHSGIATLTLLFEGGFAFEDSTGAAGVMDDGAVEWMQAGGGVWHTSTARGARGRGYQLWIALPAAAENAPARSQYLDKAVFESRGPARIILGDYLGASSPIRAPAPMNYLDVRMMAGEIWRYAPPAGHDIAWIAVHEGRVGVPASVEAGELAVFEDGAGTITFSAQGDTAFILGSAPRHPHELVLGYYSVHTSAEALKKGEEGIARIGVELRRAGTL
jgi:redox-sensitive bicupin YhaK (pirin superfamily)